MPEKRVTIVFMAGSKPKSIKFDKAVIDRLNRWAATQPVKPSLSAIVKAAVDEFLERHERAAAGEKPKK